MARLYSNQNFPLPVVEKLRALSHDVLTIQEHGQRVEALLPIDLASVSHRQQVKYPFGLVEVIDDTIIPHPQSVAIHSLEVRVGKAVQHQAQPVDLSLNPPLNRKRQFEETGIEIPRVNLKWGLHRPASG
jgi:hypothetical protein